MSKIYLLKNSTLFIHIYLQLIVNWVKFQSSVIVLLLDSLFIEECLYIKYFQQKIPCVYILILMRTAKRD